MKMKIKIIALLVSILILPAIMTGCLIRNSERIGDNEKLDRLIDELNEDIKGLNDIVDRLKDEAEEYKSRIKEYIEKNKEQEDEEEKEKELIAASAGLVDPGSWTLLETYSYDSDKDGTEEKINLYTSSAKDENGVIMWDDGQVFLLELNDGTVSYELFNEYVQIGRVFFAVSDGESFGITLIVSTFAGIRLEQFRYIADDAVFENEEIYSTGDLNIIYNSMPWD